MAKSQLRSHREAKKPKQVKQTVVPAAPFIVPAGSKPAVPAKHKH